MIILKQNYINTNNEVLFEQAHIYSENGFFFKNGFQCGWHIALGSGDNIENYKEQKIEGVAHAVPASLPDVIIEIDENADEEIPAEEALKELQEVIENEEI